MLRLLGLASLAGLLGAGYVYYSLHSGWAATHPQPDPERTGPPMVPDWPARYRMVAERLDQNLLEGLTRSEVLEWLGPPTGAGLTTEIWGSELQYAFEGGPGTKEQRLMVRFDGAGLVERAWLVY